jgi:hypothetical protein
MKQTKIDWRNDKIENYLIELLINNCYEVLQLKLHNFKIIKTESPDFIINSGNKRIGIEITRALDQNLQKVHSIRDEEFNKVSFCPTLFENQKMSKKKIIKLLQKSKEQFVSMPYLNDELEEKVVSDIKKAIINKNQKFIKYKKFDRNILFIHAENRVSLDINLVIQELSLFIATIELLFNYIFLKLGDFIYYFTESSYGSCKIKT